VAHVFVETNWLFGYAAPAHHQVPAATDLLKHARLAELTLHLPNVCLGEARKVILAKCQPRNEANAIRRFLTWAEPGCDISKEDAAITRTLVDRYEKSIKRNLDTLDDRLKTLAALPCIGIFGLYDLMLARSTELALAGIELMPSIRLSSPPSSSAQQDSGTRVNGEYHSAKPTPTCNHEDRHGHVQSRRSQHQIPRLLNNLQTPTTLPIPTPCYFQIEAPIMSATATIQIDHSTIDRAAINRANSEHSTGPRTDAGKQRSSLNALRHGLTAQTAVLPTEDPIAYQKHCRQFVDEHQPATATETHLVQELADTSWRLNRIPILEARLIAEVPSPQSLVPHLAALGLHGARLSRQFQKALEQLREIQLDRRERQHRDLKDAAAMLEHHKHKGIPWDPADDGFVFSKDQVERAAQRMTRQKEAGHIEHVRFGSFSNPTNRY
jgi:hypothetical protein